jgi:hypothetical protein
MRISCDIPDWIIETILRQLVEQVGTQIHTTRTNILDRPARSFPLPQRLGYTVRIGNMIRNWEEVRERANSFGKHSQQRASDSE